MAESFAPGPPLSARHLCRFGWELFEENGWTAVRSDIKAAAVPLFRFPPVGPELAAALAQQDLRDYAAGGGLYSRYQVTPFSERALADAITRQARFLVRLHIVIARYHPAILTVMDGPERALAQIHVAAPGNQGAWFVDVSGAWTVGPDEIGTRALDADPLLPGGVRHWSCTTNELYGLRRLLLGACGLSLDLPVMGKLQTSWQPDNMTGIDGEWGYRPEVTQVDLPAYVWSAANLARARAERLRAVQIGAPVLYMAADTMDAPGAAGSGADPSGLLAFPTHSMGPCVAVLDWAAYAKDMQARAKALGFPSVTVCLHHEDIAARDRVEAEGVEAVTLGTPRAPDFLARLRDLICRHAAVTSDRVCTSAFYAAWWGRPFFTLGDPIMREPPAFDPGDVTADSLWLERNFPGFLSPTTTVHRAYAEREFGAEAKLTTDGLRSALWGWMGL